MRPRLIAITLSLALAGCAATPSPPPAAPRPTDTFTGQVAAVTDGDRLTVLRDGAAQPVRLSGIDCPELGQAFGRKAGQLAARLVSDHEVTVTEEGRDKAGAVLGVVTLPDGRSLNRELVRAGMCWWEREYRGDETLPILEAEAHAKQRGLWAQREPMPPWKWRLLKVKPFVSEKDQ